MFISLLTARLLFISLIILVWKLCSLKLILRKWLFSLHLLYFFIIFCLILNYSHSTWRLLSSSNRGIRSGELLLPWSPWRRIKLCWCLCCRLLQVRTPISSDHQHAILATPMNFYSIVHHHGLILLDTIENQSHCWHNFSDRCWLFQSTYCSIVVNCC